MMIVFVVVVVVGVMHHHENKIISFFFFFLQKGMSVMEGVDEPLAELKEKFVPTFARSCLFWLPAQAVNFYCVPPQFRIVYIGTCSLIWANILCWVKRQNSGNKIIDNGTSQLANKMI